MAILSDTIEEYAGLDCDRIFLSELQLQQKVKEKSSDTMYMSMSLAYHRYNETGEDFTLVPDAKTISIDDYVAEATIEAASGNYELLQAITAIEEAVAVIISHSNMDGNCEVIA